MAIEIKCNEFASIKAREVKKRKARGKFIINSGLGLNKIFKLNVVLFIIIIIFMLRLHCGVWAFSSCRAHRLSFSLACKIFAP